MLIMGSKKDKHGLPIIGGKVMEIGTFVYNLIFVLSDDKDPKNQEMVLYQYSNEGEAVKMKDKILQEGIALKQKDFAGLDVQIFYPVSQIRKVILKKEPAGIKPGTGITN